MKLNFLEQRPVTEEQEAMHKALYETFHKLSKIMPVEPELLMSVHMELLIKYSRQAWKSELKTTDDYNAWVNQLLKWVDQYNKIRYNKTMDEWKKEKGDAVVELNCTLCGSKLHKPRVGTGLVIPSKIHRIELEGCPDCGTTEDIRDSINSVTYYDKNGAILYHSREKGIGRLDVSEVQKIMDGV